jgi:hypothetical protein
MENENFEDLNIIENEEKKIKEIINHEKLSKQEQISYFLTNLVNKSDFLRSALYGNFLIILYRR